MEKPKGAVQLLFNLFLLISEMFCCYQTVYSKKEGLNSSLNFCSAYNTHINNVGITNTYLAGIFNGMFLKFMKYNAG